MNKLEEIDRFTYIGSTENGEITSINLRLKKNGSVVIILLLHHKKYTIPLSFGLSEKYDLIEKITQLINTKQKQSINPNINKKKYGMIKRYPVFISHNDNTINTKEYSILIHLIDTILTFHVDNIDELISSLKRGMIFPGDKFIGLEAIELLNKRNGNYYWRAKCLLCGRITYSSESNIKNQKSCGCLIGFNFDSNEERFYSKVDKQENIPKELQIRGTLGLDEEPCWLWTGYKNRQGYGIFGALKKTKRAHRYSYGLSHNKDIPIDISICHRCDNPPCVNPAHLFEGTHLDNMKDMVNKGRVISLFGENVHNSKLTEKDVLEIRTIKGKSQLQISKDYKVSPMVISRILRRKAWRHI